MNCVITSQANIAIKVKSMNVRASAVVSFTNNACCVTVN